MRNTHFGIGEHALLILVKEALVLHLLEILHLVIGALVGSLVELLLETHVRLRELLVAALRALFLWHLLSAKLSTNLPTTGLGLAYKTLELLASLEIW